MKYWNELITERSWDVLQKLKAKYRFVLIGGWAAYLYAKSHKSKDVDIIVDFGELEKIKMGHTLKKNDRLKKYEISIDGIDVDIYVPFYSRLALPVEEASKHATNVEGFDVVKPEVLLILKQGAEHVRKHSEKGLKDRIDIMDLLINCDIDFAAYHRLLKENKLENFHEQLVKIVSSFSEGSYLDLNPRQLKLKKQEILEKLKESGRA